MWWQMEVTPSPSFVIKTLDLTSKTKVFINICTSTSVAKPAMRKRLKEDGAEEEVSKNLRQRMSIPVDKSSILAFLLYSVKVPWRVFT